MPTSTEFQVNTYTTGSQDNPSITALNNGGFVVTWESSAQDGDGYGVYAQMYNADGTTQGSEFQVNTYTDSNQSHPSITALIDGGFVVTWDSYAQDGSGTGVYAQMYNADGTTQGNEFQVNTYTDSNQYISSITALNNGGFVVTWVSDGQDVGDGTYESGIYAQMYDADGTTQGSEFQVNTYTSGGQSYLSITTLNNGGFVVTWTSYTQDVDGSSGVYAQMYDANGDTQGNEFQVSTYTAEYQGQPSVTALTDGGFVVTWKSDTQDGDEDGVFAQMYNADGTTQGSEFQVTTYTAGYQWSSSITALNNGGFVVTWQSGGQDVGDGTFEAGIYAQMYNADGTTQGSEFQVNTYTTGSQDNPSITALTNGGFVVTWTSNGQDGDASGIYAQMYDADGNPMSNGILNGTDGNDKLLIQSDTTSVQAGAGTDTVVLYL